ncbi:MAG: LPS-assembly lipoprotein [Flavobacteriales bacterium]|jgi:LPS-assembly lipoprotein
MKRHLLIVSLIALSIFTSACGWQLRGFETKAGQESSEKLRLLNVYSENRSSEFYQALRTMLGRYRVSEQTNAEITLRYGKEHFERKPLAYGSTGIPVQYQLMMTIDFEALRGPKTLIESKTLIVRRNYDFDAELLIAKDREEQALRREMREDLAAQMLRLINAQL